MGKRNPIAKALRSAHLKPRVVRPAKGRGAYSRKGRQPRAD
jgi:stalled ribosome alternative rescue factor ArfA